MRMEGLEPSHTHMWQILSLLRLPFRHIRKDLNESKRIDLFRSAKQIILNYEENVNDYI